MKAAWMLALGFFATTCSAQQADWPMFQGNAAHAGVAPKAPPITKPKVLWKTKIGIQGYLNNPILADGKVFVGSSGNLHNKSDAMDGVYALDAKTGEVLWHSKTDLDACGVAYAGGRVFATSDDGNIRAFDAKSGKELWKVKCEGELYVQPLVIKNLVVVGDGSGTVLAFEQESGKKVWAVRVVDENDPQNLRGGLTASQDRIYAAFAAGTVACMDLEGKVKWRQRKVAGEIGGIYPAPTLAGNSVCIGYADGEPPPIKALDAATGKTVWKGSAAEGVDVIGNIRSSFAYWDGLLLYGRPYSNELTAINAKTGVLEWTLKLGAPMFPHWPSPAIAGDVLYLPRHDGGLYAVDLKKAKELWRFYLGDVERVGPDLPKALSDLSEPAWQPEVGVPIYASPAIGLDGTIYIGTGQGWLYAIGQDGAPASMRATMPAKSPKG